MSTEALFNSGLPSSLQGSTVAGDGTACRQGSGSAIDFALVEHSVAALV